MKHIVCAVIIACLLLAMATSKAEETDSQCSEEAMERDYYLDWYVPEEEEEEEAND